MGNNELVEEYLAHDLTFVPGKSEALYEFFCVSGRAGRDADVKDMDCGLWTSILPNLDAQLWGEVHESGEILHCGCRGEGTGGCLILWGNPVQTGPLFYFMSPASCHMPALLLSGYLPCNGILLLVIPTELGCELVPHLSAT